MSSSLINRGIHNDPQPRCTPTPGRRWLVVPVAAIVCTGLLLLSAPAASAGTVVVSPDEEPTGTSGWAPFAGSPGRLEDGEVVGRGDPVRYQQIHAASDFSAFTIPHFITRISVLTGDNRTNATIDDIQINLSTTTTAMGDLSASFADNVGTDDTVVLERGAFTFSTEEHDDHTDRVVHIDLDEHFLYDPSVGNLLLDARTFAHIDRASDGGFLARLSTLEGGQRLRGDADAESGSVLSRQLITEFTATPIPEPTMALGALALVALMGRRRRRRQPKAEEAG